MSLPTTYHVIEKENEVVFYIPYEKELLNVYTNAFFALHSQDADVSVIAFHNNEKMLEPIQQKTFPDESIGGAIDISLPYRVFYDKAKYVEEKLKERFNELPTKESSYHLFTSLVSPFLSNQNQDSGEIVRDSEIVSESQSKPEPITTLTPGYIFQISILKKPEKETTDTTSQTLKRPLDVILEKEIDYFREHAPGRPITQKYAHHGIYMIA